MLPFGPTQQQQYYQLIQQAALPGFALSNGVALPYGQYYEPVQPISLMEQQQNNIDAIRAEGIDDYNYMFADEEDYEVFDGLPSYDEVVAEQELDIPIDLSQDIIDDILAEGIAEYRHTNYLRSLRERDARVQR